MCPEYESQIQNIRRCLLMSLYVTYYSILQLFFLKAAEATIFLVPLLLINTIFISLPVSLMNSFGYFYVFMKRLTLQFTPSSWFINFLKSTSTVTSIASSSGVLLNVIQTSVRRDQFI